MLTVVLLMFARAGELPATNSAVKRETSTAQVIKSLMSVGRPIRLVSGSNKVNLESEEHGVTISRLLGLRG